MKMLLGIVRRAWDLLASLERRTTLGERPRPTLK